jgi:hypothetical protein
VPLFQYDSVIIISSVQLVFAGIPKHHLRFCASISEGLHSPALAGSSGAVSFISFLIFRNPTAKYIGLKKPWIALFTPVLGEKGVVL